MHGANLKILLEIFIVKGDEIFETLTWNNKIR